MGMCVYGYESTVPVTMDQCIVHCEAVRRGATNTFVMGDMPFMSYQRSDEDAVANAGRFLKEASVDAIKLGSPIFANVILIGALIGSGVLPLDNKSLEPILRENFPREFIPIWQLLTRGWSLQVTKRLASSPLILPLVYFSMTIVPAILSPNLNPFSLVKILTISMITRTKTAIPSRISMIQPIIGIKKKNNIIGPSANIQFLFAEIA